MSIAHKILPHYTYDDWVRWEGVWELIEGHPIAMSPTPIPEHQRVAAEIRTELTLALRKSNCKHCRAYDPLDYKIADDTILVPDIMIVCGEIKKKYLDFPPALVVEVLSPASALRDRHTKFQLYQQQAVSYYLIVDAQERQIEVYHFENGEYVLQHETSNPEFIFDSDCRISPDLKNVFN